MIHHSDAARSTFPSATPSAWPKPASIGSKGDSYDNALAETINGLYKAEPIHRRAPWKTVESLELATLEWVTRFNHQRLLEPIGCIPAPCAETKMPFSTN